MSYPARPIERTRCIQIACRMTPAQARTLTAEAKRRGTQPAVLVRRAVAIWMREHSVATDEWDDA